MLINQLRVSAIIDISLFLLSFCLFLSFLVSVFLFVSLSAPFLLFFYFLYSLFPTSFCLFLSLPLKPKRAKLPTGRTRSRLQDTTNAADKSKTVTATKISGRSTMRSVKPPQAKAIFAAEDDDSSLRNMLRNHNRVRVLKRHTERRER